jgi:hypothetical protein
LMIGSSLLIPGIINIRESKEKLRQIELLEKQKKLSFKGILLDANSVGMNIGISFDF